MCYPASDLLDCSRQNRRVERISVEMTARPARQATMARAKVALESCSTRALTPIAAPWRSPTLGGFRRVSASPALCSACPHRPWEQLALNRSSADVFIAPHGVCHVLTRL